MLKIAICDDINEVCVQTEDILDRICRNNGIKSEIEIFYSGISLKKQFDNGSYYDVIFLDIEMDGMNGIEVSKYLRDQLNNDSMQIVFISGKKDYAIDLFDYDPIVFLLKPLDENKIEKAFNKLVKKLNLHADAFEYKVGHYSNKVAKKDIVYLESNGRVIQINYYLGEEKTDSFYGTIDGLKNQLKEQDGFLQINKGVIINSLHIKEYLYDHVVMNTGRSLHIAQPRRKHIRELQLKYELED